MFENVLKCLKTIMTITQKSLSLSKIIVIEVREVSRSLLYCNCCYSNHIIPVHCYSVNTKAYVALADFHAL